MKKEKFLGIVETIGGTKYKVYIVSKIEGKNSYVGVTDYEEKIIKIEKGTFSEMLLTFKHELMHIWLYERGYKEQDGGCFSYEELCELAAKASRFIQTNVDEFFRYF